MNLSSDADVWLTLPDLVSKVDIQNIGARVEVYLCFLMRCKFACMELFLLQSLRELLVLGYISWSSRYQEPHEYYYCY